MVMRMVLFITLLTHSFTAYSQVGTVYPVEINAMLTPPYGTCLTDYVGTNRFQCNVLMRDMRATGYKFRILMTVKDMASGRVMFAAQSDQHTITPGMPTYMAETGVFGEFFKPENILSSTAYRDGCMNEGAYNFVFQIVDDRDSRRIPISKECVFPARLDAGGAPFLTSPFTGTNIDCNQTIVNLTWQMPFVTGEQIQYLVEVCPSDEGGTGLQYLNDNIRTNYYYSATTYMPMHVLQKTEMMLRENTTYFWRVSILDKDGNVKRNSSSEIDSFSYCYTKELEPYVPLKEPKVKAINGKLDTVHIDTVKTEDNSTKAYWILDEVRFKYQSYALDIRKKSQDTWTSYYIEIKEGYPEEKNYYGLSNLKYNELYEARMQYLLITDGDTAYAPYSDTITFKVPNPMDTADCGEIMPIKDCDGEKGKILKKYDTLYANGTPVVLDSIIYKAEDSTVISGFGIVAFPIVQNFKLKMKFNEVSVNCYGELVSGQVVSVYNESTGAIVDLNRLFGKGDGGGSQSSNEKPEVTKYDSKDDAAKNMPTGGYAQVGDSIYTKDKDGNLVNVGSPLEIPADKYTNDNGLDDDDVYCIFRNDTKDAPYIGFDADEKNIYRKVASLSDHYQSFSKQAGSDNEYIIPYVASNPGRVVKLSATLEGRLTQEYNMDSVKFIMPLSGGNYLSLNAKKENDKFIVDFPGGQNPDTNCDVYAIVKKGDKYVNVGKINIETYAWRKQKVKIVPVVNDYDVNINAVSETLNRIYGRFGITYEVTKDGRFESENINSEFLDNFSVSSGTFTKQSDDMKKLQFFYKVNRGIQDSTAYIFLLKSAVDYPTIDGDMPQGQICGYIFMHSDKGTLSDGRLVAHELAHGIYKLDHVFEKAYGIPENSTDNLLDYNNGDQLAHFQWELIKNPGFAWALLESDEDNMGVIVNNDVQYSLNKLKKTFPGKKVVCFVHNINESDYKKVYEKEKICFKRYDIETGMIKNDTEYQPKVLYTIINETQMTNLFICLVDENKIDFAHNYNEKNDRVDFDVRNIIKNKTAELYMMVDNEECSCDTSFKYLKTYDGIKQLNDIAKNTDYTSDSEVTKYYLSVFETLFACLNLKAKEESKIRALAKINEFAGSTITSPWKHIKKEDLVKGLTDYVKKPGEMVRQEESNMCGMALCVKTMTEQNPEKIVDMAIAFYKGETYTSDKGNSYKPNENLYDLEKKFDYEGEWVDDKGKIHKYDVDTWKNQDNVTFLLMSNLRNEQNAILSYQTDDTFEGLSGFTWPSDITKLLKDEFDYVDAESHFWFDLDESIIDKFKSCLDQGYYVGLLLYWLDKEKKSNLVKNQSKNLISQHYVQLKDIKKLSDGKVELTIWTWGNEHYIIEYESVSFFLEVVNYYWIYR